MFGDSTLLRRRPWHKARKRKHTSTLAAQWAVPGEAQKVGAGLLFFAYGGVAEVQKFLAEAANAAATFRQHNPSLPIAIITNNKSADPAIFSHHIVPRNELLFPGSPCPDQCRGDQLMRQWTTRLYYMALSPFRITWALDSGVAACPGPASSGAVQRYLDAALKTDLWGYDIAQASQAKGDTMYPHNWNLLLNWNERTSNVVCQLDSNRRPHVRWNRTSAPGELRPNRRARIRLNCRPHVHLSPTL